MAGNELSVVSYLFDKKGKIILSHLGKLTEIGAPNFKGGYQVISSISDLKKVSTEDSSKKADIYLNGKGVSIKQSGSSFPFNRIQRAEIIKLFGISGFPDPKKSIKKIDKEVDNFHKGLLGNRRRPWQKFFSEEDFKRMVKYLMTEGSPNLGKSLHPAEYILEAPKSITKESDINISTFDEYFNKFKKNIYFSIRRQWIGQSSTSEHKRALGLAKKVGNKPWVYNEVKGEPRISKKTGKKWRDDVEEKDRKTVYMIFVEKG